MDGLKITTARLTLRPLAPADAAALFAYRSDKETNQYQGWVPETITQAEQFIAKLPASFNAPESWYQLAICEQDQVIGDIGVHFTGAENRQVELGCTMDRQHHRKGYATEALKGLMDHLFTVLEKHRIYASVDPRNTASVQLMKRLGFRQEAHFVKGYFFKGEWVDDLMFAMLREEWGTDGKHL